MSKLMPVVAMTAAVVAFVAPLSAAEKSEAAVPVPEEKVPPGEEAAAEGAEEDEPQIFEAGFDFDFFSAYVWRNTVSSDEMVMQPCVWADLTYFDPFWIGFSIWQNYNLTDRHCEAVKYGIDETDYNVHLGATAWESEDEEYSLDLEIGHEWFTYHGVRYGLDDSYPDTREVYVKATFNNPFVGVYGQASWMYEGFGNYERGMHYELGFNKEIELVETLTLGADWNLNFGDPRYLRYLYGGVESGAYDHGDGEDPWDDYDSDPKGGFGGTTVKLYLTWQITDWMSVGGVVAYTGVLNSSLRDAIGDQAGEYYFCENPGESYPRDLLWGGLQLKISY